MKIAKIETFQMEWGAPGKGPRSAFVRIEDEDGQFGLGEASPMQGGLASLVIIANDMAPFLIGKDALDHAVLLDTLFHKCVKLGPEGATTAALAALDIALWDLKGKLLGQPVYKLLGGAWRTSLTCYASVGGNAFRTVDEVVAVVTRRVEKEKPAAVKIRWDGDRTKQDIDIPGDIAKARPSARRWATASSSGSTPTTATRSVAPCGSAARWKTLATPGLRSRFSTTTSLPWARSLSASTSRSPPASRPTRSRASRT